MFAVVATGGKQYRVAEGQTITVERVDAEVGASVELPALMTVGNDGAVASGTAVDGKTVTATVESHSKAPRIRVFTYKNKSRQHKRRGHRQLQTTLKISKI